MTTTTAIDGLTELVFQVAEIRFANEAFHIVVTTSGDSVSGNFNAKEGYCFKSRGTWINHPKYGRTFKLETAEIARMTTPEALGRFLLKAMKGRGIGEKFIGSLVDSCKEASLDLERLLDTLDKETLIELCGKRNEKKIEGILADWPSIKPQADLITPLLNYGLNVSICEALLRIYGKKAIDVVENDPYSLIQSMEGVSFLRADAIAMKVGKISQTSDRRLRAALAAGLREATAFGDLGVARRKLVQKTMPLINPAIVENGRRKLDPEVPPTVTESMLLSTLNDMVTGVIRDESGVECEFSCNLLERPDEKGETVIWYKPLVDAEDLAVARLSRFNAPPRPDLVAKIDDVLKLSPYPLAEQQRSAIEMVLMNPVSIITGGPGVGKSYIQDILLKVLDLDKQNGKLAAPTGKAAKRIKEATGRFASTLHSLIGWGPGGTMHNAATPLVAHYLVVDESSMADIELFAKTLNAAPNHCRIILVGDVEQLPSVGPGQVLRDLIRSRVIPVTRLTKGFRFAGGIAEAANEILHGVMPASTADNMFIYEDTDTPKEKLLEAVAELIKSGVNPDDIQVLAPTHKGDAGCISLNVALQALLNPAPLGERPEQRLKREHGDLRIGDRIMVIKNDNELGLVNGDVGWLDEINSETGEVVISLPDNDKPIKLPHDKALRLVPALAITVHKSQGAEAKYVLVAVDRSAAFMLRRALIYTGVTRAKTQVRVFGPASTLHRGVRMGEPPEGSRRTMLVSKLKAFLPSLPPADIFDEGAELEDPLASVMRLPTADIDI